MIPVAQPQIGPEERAAVDRILESGLLAQGTEVESFEAEFSEAVVNGVHCVAVNSGTSALHLSLLAAGIGAGDEVLVPSFTFAATANAVALTGATPIFVDINPSDYCMSPDAAAAAIGSRTVALLPVHLYGHPAALGQLKELCDRRGLLLLEDAAQAHAASLNGQPVGTWGQLGAFSFYPTKNMTTGEGGMVTTTDSSFARTVRLLRNQGQERRYENEVVGLNNRMTDINAAIGRVQLRKLGERTLQRRSNAQFFDAELRNVATPTVAPGAYHVYHQYTIRVEGPDRERVVSELAARGVGSGIYYPCPTHRLPAYSRTEDLPETERAAREVLSLPVHPSLSLADLEHIVTAVNVTTSSGA